VFLLPLAGLFLLLHVPIVAALAAGLWGRLGSLGAASGRLAQWALLVAGVDLVLLAAAFAFVGRTLRQAAPAPEGPRAIGGGPGRLGMRQVQPVVADRRRVLQPWLTSGP
jgi:hypothetical protein